MAPTFGRKKLNILTRMPRPIAGALAQEADPFCLVRLRRTDIRPGTCCTMASQNRPKVGATRGVWSRFFHGVRVSEKLADGLPNHLFSCAATWAPVYSIRSALARSGGCAVLQRCRQNGSMFKYHLATSSLIAFPGQRFHSAAGVFHARYNRRQYSGTCDE